MAGSSSVLSHVMDAKLSEMSLNTFDFERWKLLQAEKIQIRDTLEDRPLPPPIECLSVVLDLFVNYYHRSERHGLPLLRSTMDQAIRVTHMLCNATEKDTYNVNHHFTALAAMVLVEALKHPEHKEQALTGLDDLASNLWADKISIGAGDRWLTALKKFAAASMSQHQDAPGAANGGPDRAGLQHLADAAVGETETAAGGNNSRASSRRGSREYTHTVPKGYLTTLAQHVRSSPEA